MINKRNPSQSWTRSFLLSLILVDLVSSLIGQSSFLHTSIVVSEPSVSLLLLATNSAGTLKLLEDDHRNAARQTRPGLVTMCGKDDELVAAALVCEACTVAHSEEEARVRRGERRGLGNGKVTLLALSGGTELRWGLCSGGYVVEGLWELIVLRKCLLSRCEEGVRTRSSTQLIPTPSSSMSIPSSTGTFYVLCTNAAPTLLRQDETRRKGFRGDLWLFQLP